ncbi:MAG: hypothetical protein GX457_17110 [Thermotogaceae bacterium]|nr:hypothetical protein [Thermotogaceae bacterium]
MNNDRDLGLVSERENSNPLVRTDVQGKLVLLEDPHQIDIFRLKLQTTEIQVHSVG